jgi:hypothetical protein
MVNNFFLKYRPTKKFEQEVTFKFITYSKDIYVAKCNFFRRWKRTNELNKLKHYFTLDKKTLLNNKAEQKT